MAFVAAIAISFFAGVKTKEKMEQEYRAQQCRTLLSFAIDKTANQDLSDPDVVEALCSNVYAAYQFCDTPALADQLHTIWNHLVFADDSFPAQNQLLTDQLTNISEQLLPLH